LVSRQTVTVTPVLTFMLSPPNHNWPDEQSNSQKNATWCRSGSVVDFGVEVPSSSICQRMGVKQRYVFNVRLSHMRTWGSVPTWVGTIMAADSLRGGRKRERDRFHGLEAKPNFEDFRRWWHRRGKRIYNDGEDIRDRQQAEGFWRQWEYDGCPVVTFGENNE
jgi:hypothetical protein